MTMAATAQKQVLAISLCAQVDAAALREALAESVIGKAGEKGEGGRVVLLRGSARYGEPVIEVIGRDDLMQSTLVVSARTRADSEWGAGQVLACADKLRAALMGMEGPVDLDGGAAAQLVVRNGRRRFVVPTLDAAAFALFDGDQRREIAVEAERLRQGLERVVYAAEVANTGRGMFGVCLHPEGVVATDSTQLAYDDFPIGLPGEQWLTVSTPAVAKVIKALHPGATVSVMGDASAIEVELVGNRLLARLQGIHFPTMWRRIVPPLADAKFVVKLDPATARGPLQRAAAFLDGKIKMVDIVNDSEGGALELRNEKGGELDDTLPCEVAGTVDERVPLPQLLEVLAMAGGAAVTWYGGDSVRAVGDKALHPHVFAVEGRGDRHVMSPVKR